MSKTKIWRSDLVRRVGMIAILAIASRLNAQEVENRFIVSSIPIPNGYPPQPVDAVPLPPHGEMVGVPQSGFEPSYSASCPSEIPTVVDSCDCFRCRFKEYKRQMLRGWLSWCHRKHRNFINPVCPPGCMPGYGHFQTTWRPFEAQFTDSNDLVSPWGAPAYPALPDADMVPTPAPKSPTQPNSEPLDSTPMPNQMAPGQPAPPHKPKYDEGQVQRLTPRPWDPQWTVISE